jgi:hypothetical protein
MIDLSNESSDRVADWIELVAASRHGMPFSVQKIQEISQRLANVNAMVVPYAFKVLHRRSASLGGFYPFTVDGDFIATKKTIENSVYLRLLFVTPGPWRTIPTVSWNADIASKLFEDVVDAALTSFFGANTHTINFGFPSRNGRPADFPSAIEWLSKKTNIRLGNAFRPPRKKDGGVDLFVWKSFGDEKPGFPIMLVQCTIMDDFVNKIGDIDIRLWSSWLSSDIAPLTALAIPGIASDDNLWSEITTRGILLDRFRLVETSADLPPTVAPVGIEYLRQSVLDFSDAVR